MAVWIGATIVENGVMTTRASQDALQAAEEAERADLAADEAVTAVKADKSGSLDDTRYMDDL